MNLVELWRDCAYLRDLLEQPDAVARTIDGLRQARPLSRFAADLRDGRFRRIVLTGMGSSYYACQPLYLRLLAAGFTPLMVETSELIHYQRELLDSGTLVVAVSQSGQSAETVRLLELAGGRPEIIGVTNTADSPLATQTAGTVVTCAGAESTVSCKTYLAALVGLEWLADALCCGGTTGVLDEVQASVEPMRKYLQAWTTHVGELLRVLEGVQDVFVVGRGPSLAAAGTGGLVLKESTHYHAEGMSAAAFRHGPFEMLSKSVFVLIFEGDDRSAGLNRNLAGDVRAAGGRAAIVSPESEGVFQIPACRDRVRPLMEMLPVDMMTLALAAAKGKEPGRFERASKVTVTE